MKKTSINILCILIICILAASVTIPSYMMGTAFITGFTKGWDETQDGAETMESYMPVDLAFNPDEGSYYHPTDTIRMADGRELPVIIRRAVVILPEDASQITFNWISVGCMVAALVFSIMTVIEFAKFIIRINRGFVFVRANVKRLRRLAVYLLCLALMQSASGIIDDCMLSGFDLQLEGYSLSSYWLIPWTTCILGLMALLMAEIWARGIQLQEDNELTI